MPVLFTTACAEPMVSAILGLRRAALARWGDAGAQAGAIVQSILDSTSNWPKAVAPLIVQSDLSPGGRRELLGEAGGDGAVTRLIQRPRFLP